MGRFIGENNRQKIVGQWKVKLFFSDGRFKALINALHILGLAKKFIFVSMNDLELHVTFEKSETIR